MATNSWPRFLCSFNQGSLLRLLGGLCCIWCLSACISAPAAPRPPPLQGSFLQLQASHQHWSAQDWQTLFTHFERLRLKRLIVQWTRHEGVAFHQPGSAGQPSPLEYILTLAAEKNMRVSVGLHCDPHYWQAIAQPPETRAAYLAGLRQRSLQQAHTLNPLLQRHSAFAGWYISEEIDDINWQTRDAARLLQQHLAALSRALATQNPQYPIAISGFSNGAQGPQALAQFWQELLRAAPDIRELLFQDGIGVHKQSLETLPPYLEALQSVSRQERRVFSVVVETFTQIAGPPIDQQDFRAEPAAIGRLQQQLMLARRFGSAIAFSVPEYMSPQGGAQATMLFDDYLRLLPATRLEKPAGPGPTP